MIEGKLEIKYAFQNKETDGEGGIKTEQYFTYSSFQIKGF